jgi:hypothetical protein
MKTSSKCFTARAGFVMLVLLFRITGKLSHAQSAELNPGGGGGGPKMDNPKRGGKKAIFSSLTYPSNIIKEQQKRVQDCDSP